MTYFIQTAPRNIGGNGYYAAVQDNVRLGRWADVGAGIRYDYRSTHSEDKVSLPALTATFLGTRRSPQTFHLVGFDLSPSTAPSAVVC